ncbi:Dicer-like protein 2 [Venturia nashicola]|uniref:Dicer-like protein 2 n=1 Tax=Venturia nashicola TaxID=86259 RepID=A0A4Z1PGT7_9PEZI|nr:Dicer-like protein 2 [Venturia nashicola]
MPDETIPEGETPNQRQARLRRERRNAKIAAGGSSRLEAITQLSGRQHAAQKEAAATPTLSQSISRVDTPDPDIQDISEHHYIPRTMPRPPTSSSPAGCGTPNPMDMLGAPAGGTDGNEDPMMKLMQQMMGAAGGDGAGQIPPGLAEMLGGAGGGMPGQPQQAALSSSAYLWRIVHAIFSLTLAMYVVLTTPFTGTKAARNASVYSLEDEQSFGQRLFYLFATVEVVLQSSRYFIEKGQLAPVGIMGTLAQFLPMPYAGWIKVAGRYGVIYTTVVADAMVVVFVLGAMAWWKGGVMETR